MHRDIKLRGSSGIAALTTMLGIGLAVSVMGAAMGLLSFLESTIGFSHAKAQEAYLVAQSGAADALMRLARDKTFSSVGYSVSVGNGTTTVVVVRNNPVIGQNLITSTGEVSNRKRKIEVKVAVDNTSGKLTLLSWREISL